MRDDADFYPGVGQLEAMEEAENYNRHLLNSVISSTKSQNRLLDYGAGLGFYAKRLKAQGLNVDCLEPDATMVQALKREGFVVHSDTGAETHEFYDVVYCLNVLEHIEDDLGALKGMLDALKPEGRLILYVPAFQVLFSSMDHFVGHKRRYRLQPLKQRVAEAGFRIDRASYVDSLGFFAALVYRLTDPGDGVVNRRYLRLYDRFVFPISRLLDFACRFAFGKNVIVYATRPQSTGAGRGSETN